MKDNPLLSVCIPTYNRADYLKNCLDAIVRQFEDEKVKNHVEIVISDNASTDNTVKLVKEYQTKYDNIKYYRNEKNFGPDENMITSVLKAGGKYCWTIGDDDFIQNGGLEFIIETLEKKPVSLLTVGLNQFVDLKACSQKIKKLDSNIVFYCNSAEEFWSKGYCQGTFGILISNRELWLKVDRKNYVELWVYYEIVLKMITNSNLPQAYINYPLIFIGQDYRWKENGTGLLTSINFKKLLNKLPTYGYSKKFIDSKKLMLAKSLPRTLLSAKSYNLKCSFYNLKLIYQEFYNYPINVFVATLVFLIPNQAIRLVKLIKSKIKK